MTTLLKAKDIIEVETTRLKTLCGELSKPPCLKVLLVGNDPASRVYVEHKKKLCEKVGAICEIVHLKESISEDEFLDKLKQLNDESNTDGLIVQLPLPGSLKDINVYNLVNPSKDVDGFHFQNFQEVYQGLEGASTLVPCTPKGILKILDHYKIPLEGKSVAVIGRSQIVGKPVAHLLLNRNATVTLCHSRTKNLKEVCAGVDIIIAAAGQPEFIDSSFLGGKKDKILIDVGIHKKESGKLCGDLNFDSIVNHGCAAITPVPGGVGPMTVLCLIENLIIATRKRRLEK